MSDTLLFFSGAAMHPEAIRAAYPEGRFVARARIACAAADVAPGYVAAVVDASGAAAVWGIVVRTNTPAAGPLTGAVTDEGAALTVVVAEQPHLGGDVESALEAALYWELPPAYTIRLREAAGVAAPEAEGGWESMQLGQQPPTS
jgi:hypothetical protein